LKDGEDGGSFARGMDGAAPALVGRGAAPGVGRGAAAGVDGDDEDGVATAARELATSVSIATTPPQRRAKGVRWITVPSCASADDRTGSPSALQEFLEPKEPGGAEAR
jgi:hypothetical protein